MTPAQRRVWRRCPWVRERRRMKPREGNLGLFAAIKAGTGGWLYCRCGGALLRDRADVHVCGKCGRANALAELVRRGSA